MTYTPSCDTQLCDAERAVLPLPLQLRSSMAPQYLQTAGGRVAYHSVPPTPEALHAPGVIFCGGA